MGTNLDCDAGQNIKYYKTTYPTMKSKKLAYAQIHYCVDY